MSWIVWKGRASIFLSLIEARTSVNSHVLLQFKKQWPEFHKFHDFLTLKADCARLRGHWIFKVILFQLQFMIDKSRAIWSQNQKSWNLWNSGHWFFWIVRVRVIWHVFQLQLMKDRWTPHLLKLSTTFYDVSVLCNIFWKTEMRQFGASGIDGLTLKNLYGLVIFRSDKDFERWICHKIAVIESPHSSISWIGELELTSRSRLERGPPSSM